jgi:hypothetical protein
VVKCMCSEKVLATHENASIARRPFLISLSSYFAAAAGVLEKFSGSVVATIVLVIQASYMKLYVSNQLVGSMA